jgi:hypothetical protein
MKSTGKQIIIAGDIAVDWIGWEKEPTESAVESKTGIKNWNFWPGLRMTCDPGGVLLLKSYLDQKSWTDISKPTLISHKIETPEVIPPRDIIHSNTILIEFPISKGIKEKVWRVSRYCGFAGPDEFKNYPLEHDIPNPDIVVLDDCGNGFRDHPEAWPSCIREGTGSPLIILKMSRPLAEGKLWKTLAKRNSNNLIVIVSAKDIRQSGVLISHRLSWERTVSDLLWHLRYNKKLEDLAAIGHLIVRFGIEGGVYYKYNDGYPSAKFLYTPKYSEDGANDLFPGQMQGLFDAFTAALIFNLVVGNGEVSENGLKEGLLSQWRLFRKGFGSKATPSMKSFGHIFEQSPEDPGIAAIEVPDSLHYFYDPHGTWTILETVLTKELEVIAENYVKKGKSSELDRVPVGSWGKLLTIDRSEIESFQSIRNLIQEYLKNHSVHNPLCISVFGPPGSGKSFGVKQLAASIEGSNIKEIVFNLSQSDSPDDLPMMFHKIRDEVLKGMVPLVFFDEFDATLQNRPFGWLKYFLAPMQDGEFKDGEGMHPIGKAIFIFAGGTCQRYEEFNKRIMDIKDAKGPDFISRLKGYINIRGCNPSEYGDQFYLIRRAMQFRSIIEREKGHLISPDGTMSIDDGVVRAFLNVRTYLHGTRSMEAIILGSSLSGTRIFDQSALPPRDQLRVHVDDEDFIRHLSGENLKRDPREAFAEQIHENYLKTSNPPSVEANKPWAQLPEDYRDSNRQQADDFIRKIRRCKYNIRPARALPVSPIQLPDEDIEKMAIMEHDRWREEKVRKGWIYAAVKDDVKKTHPCLIEWEKLSDSDKDKDRSTVKIIPDMLGAINFEIYKENE